MVIFDDQITTSAYAFLECVYAGLGCQISDISVVVINSDMTTTILKIYISIRMPKDLHLFQLSSIVIDQ